MINGYFKWRKLIQTGLHLESVSLTNFEELRTFDKQLNLTKYDLFQVFANNDGKH